MKKRKCKVLLHGALRQYEMSFDSITEAKNWIRNCWNKPYTIIKL